MLAGTMSRIQAIPHPLVPSKPSLPRAIAFHRSGASRAPSISRAGRAPRRGFGLSASRRSSTGSFQPIASLGEERVEATGKRGGAFAVAALIVAAVANLFSYSARASTVEEDFVKRTVSSNDIVIFSKTYCPYCGMAKAVFKELKKIPYVVELDQREDGQDIQDALEDIVGRRTVPQVFIKGNHLGGSDDTVEAYESGRLEKLLGI